MLTLIGRTHSYLSLGALIKITGLSYNPAGRALPVWNGLFVEYRLIHADLPGWLRGGKDGFNNVQLIR